MNIQVIVCSMLVLVALSQAAPAEPMKIKEALEVVREYNRAIQELEDMQMDNLDKRDASALNGPCGMTQSCGLDGDGNQLQCNIELIVGATGECKECVSHGNRCSSWTSSQKNKCCSGLTCKENAIGWLACLNE